MIEKFSVFVEYFAETAMKYNRGLQKGNIAHSFRHIAMMKGGRRVGGILI